MTGGAKCVGSTVLRYNQPAQRAQASHASRRRKVHREIVESRTASARMANRSPSADVDR